MFHCYPLLFLYMEAGKKKWHKIAKWSAADEGSRDQGLGSYVAKPSWNAVLLNIAHLGHTIYPSF